MTTDIRKTIVDLAKDAIEETKKDIVETVVDAQAKVGEKEDAQAAVLMLACAEAIGTCLIDKIKNMRRFEKMSKEAHIPSRGTENSAGYDLVSPIEATIGPGQTVTIPLGIRAMFPKDEALMIYPRSSMGKNGIVLANTVGIIDPDYYGNEDNGGEIMLMLRNESEKTYFVNAGDKVAQAIFTTFNITDYNKPKSKKRTGGIGSTGA